MPDDFSLIPSQDGFSVDERLTAAVTGLTSDTAEDDAMPLGRGWVMDFETGQLVRHGTAPARVYGLDNLQAWIEKTLRTARFAHPIYSEDYGVEEPWEDYGRTVTQEVTSRLQEKWTTALTVHDRIADVTDWRFNHDPAMHVLQCSFTVLVDDEEPGEQTALVLEDVAVPVNV